MRFWRFAPLFLGLLLAVGRPAMSQNDLQCSRSFSLETYQFESIQKPLLIAATSDMKSYCRQMMGERFLRSKKIGDEAISNAHESGTFTELLDRQFPADEPALFSTPWSRSLIPTEKQRTEGARKAIYAPGKTRTFDALKNFMSGPPQLKRLHEDPPLSFFWANFGSLNSSWDPSFQLKKYFGGKITCGEFPTVDQEKCRTAFSDSISTADPTMVGYTAVSFVPVVKELLTEARYVEPIKRATLKVLSRLANPSARNSNSNVLEDLTSSFVESGWSKRDAEDAAWKAMGLIGSAGANLNQRLFAFEFPAENQQTAAGLSAIAGLLPLIDWKYADEKKNIYSLPSGVTSSCDGKPNYHFWMTAYLARDQTRKTGDGKAAATAAFNLEKVYHINGVSWNRHVGGSLMYSSISPVHAVVRMDLAFGSAGAVYGAAQAKGQAVEIDIDAGIRQLNQEARYNRALTSDEVKELKGWTGKGIYDRWNQTFNSNASFERELKKLSQ